MTLRVRLFAAVSPVVALSLVTSLAGAEDPIAACVAASRAGQESQRAGKLRAARVSYVKCDAAVCPVEVREVCERLLVSAEQSQPTVVLAAKDEDDQDLIAVHVSLDGAPIVDALDGKAIDVDPGHHVFRFVRKDGRSVDVSMLAREGEKNRPVTAKFEKGIREAPVEQKPTTEVSRSPFAYVLGGAGVVALGIFGALAVDGQRRYDDCNARRCAPSTVDALSTERIVAWGSLGVGVVALGAATWIFLHPTPVQSSTVSVGVRGESFWIRGSF